jgi:hypothetical protein
MDWESAEEPLALPFSEYRCPVCVTRVTVDLAYPPVSCPFSLFDSSLMIL